MSIDKRKHNTIYAILLKQIIRENPLKTDVFKITENKFVEATLKKMYDQGIIELDTREFPRMEIKIKGT